MHNWAEQKNRGPETACLNKKATAKHRGFFWT